MTIYQPVNQEGWNGRLFVRAHSDAYALMPAISRVIHEMSFDQPVEKASTLGDIRAEVLTPDKLNAIVFGGFCGCCIADFSRGCRRRTRVLGEQLTREFGIRMALGAQRRNILANVLVEGLVMAAIGVTVGVVLGFGLVVAAGRYITEIHQPGALAFVASAFAILAAAVAVSATRSAPRKCKCSGGICEQSINRRLDVESEGSLLRRLRSADGKVRLRGRR